MGNTKEWEMSFHLDKCNRLPITRSKKTNPQQVDYTLHGSDPGDSPLSQVPGRDAAVRPRMGNSHQQRLCQGEQDARLPRKKPESLLSEDQGAFLQGIDPTHHWVRGVCSVGPPQRQTHLQPWEGPEKGSTLRAEQTPEHLKCWRHAPSTEMVNPTAQTPDHRPHHAVQDHHWSSVCEVPWPQTAACRWKKKPPQPRIPRLQLPHRLQKQHLLPPHSQGPERTPSRCSSVPHPWHLQVEGVIPLPVNPKTFPKVSRFFFFLPVSLLTLRNTLKWQ